MPWQPVKDKRAGVVAYRTRQRYNPGAYRMPHDTLLAAKTMNLSSTSITVNGKQLEALWHGPSPERAPTLVFLHEGLGCVAMWRDFPARLAAAVGCSAFVFSRLGYGGSGPCELPRPLDFMHEEGLNVMPAVIAAAGIGDHIVIGHSDGGSIGIVYAGGTPAPGLKGLITEAAHVFCEAISVASIERARDAYVNGDLRPRLAKYHGANTDGAFWGWNGVWLHPEFIHWNLEPFLPGIRVPLLAIQGENDPYGTVAQLDAIARKDGAGAQRVLLSDCAHCPHHERPAATFARMKAFILKILQKK
ncbi:MAG: alpha/beta hydrolase [Desulfobacterales bacterium]|nr:alpha/beta hydrolase [Desulfobacterales bacterium]